VAQTRIPDTFRCQFHQHLQAAFFLQNLFAALFSTFSFALGFVIFGIEIISAKAAHKMMAKLRTGLNFTNAV